VGEGEEPKGLDDNKENNQENEDLYLTSDQKTREAKRWMHPERPTRQREGVGGKNQHRGSFGSNSSTLVGNARVDHDRGKHRT